MSAAAIEPHHTIANLAEFERLVSEKSIVIRSCAITPTRRGSLAAAPR